MLFCKMSTVQPGLCTSRKILKLKSLGATFEAVPDRDKENLRLKNGLKIKELERGLFSNGGIREGFIIQRINNISINSKKDIEFALANANDGFLKVEGVYPDGMRIIYGFEL